MNMRLEQLAPLVDIERDPWADMDACFEILLDEGWSFNQVQEWARLAFVLCPGHLRVVLRERRN